MAGFAGILGAKRFEQEGTSELARMVQRLVHEPHHSVDSVASHSLGMGAGWVRDGNAGGAVQAWNSGRDIALVLVGEQFGDAASGNGDRPGRQRKCRASDPRLREEGSQDSSKI